LVASLGNIKCPDITNRGKTKHPLKDPMTKAARAWPCLPRRAGKAPVGPPWGTQMQPKSPNTPSPVGPIPSLEPRDVDTLAYIHSNKFITTKLFHQKFHPHHSLWTACLHLNRLAERGLVLRARNLPNEDSF